MKKDITIMGYKFEVENVPYEEIKTLEYKPKIRELIEAQDIIRMLRGEELSVHVDNELRKIDKGITKAINLIVKLGN